MQEVKKRGLGIIGTVAILLAIMMTMSGCVVFKRIPNDDIELEPTPPSAGIDQRKYVGEYLFEYEYERGEYQTSSDARDCFIRFYDDGVACLFAIIIYNGSYFLTNIDGKEGYQYTRQGDKYIVYRKGDRDTFMPIIDRFTGEFDIIREGEIRTTSYWESMLDENIGEMGLKGERKMVSTTFAEDEERDELIRSCYLDSTDNPLPPGKNYWYSYSYGHKSLYKTRFELKSDETITIHDYRDNLLNRTTKYTKEECKWVAEIDNGMLVLKIKSKKYWNFTFMIYKGIFNGELHQYRYRYEEGQGTNVINQGYGFDVSLVDYIQRIDEKADHIVWKKIT